MPKNTPLTVNLTVKQLCTLFLCGFSLVALSACASVESEAKYPTGLERTANEDIYEKPDSILGPDGFSLFDSTKKEDAPISSITVNSFLWRASLDTVAFMPLASADPFGGVILTDWYEPPETAGERFKINVFILDKALRSDAISVRVFKQEKRGGSWRDVNTPDETARKLEDTILTRARQARVAQLGNL